MDLEWLCPVSSDDMTVPCPALRRTPRCGPFPCRIKVKAHVPPAGQPQLPPPYMHPLKQYMTSTRGAALPPSTVDAAGWLRRYLGGGLPTGSYTLPTK